MVCWADGITVAVFRIPCFVISARHTPSIPSYRTFHVADSKLRLTAFASCPPFRVYILGIRGARFDANVERKVSSFSLVDAPCSTVLLMEINAPWISLCTLFFFNKSSLPFSFLAEWKFVFLDKNLTDFRYFHRFIRLFSSYYFKLRVDKIFRYSSCSANTNALLPFIEFL